ncbi:MAG: molybdopterin molybdenumtransferase MoeA, partial [Synergistaceae bacterium]|nr:molybdopterin molybdenumtransferase MoeA [Synergistaceae bacterium]
MAGFVKEVTPRQQALSHISEALNWPWACETEALELRSAIGRRLSSAIFADSDHPPYTRSLRDGYAVWSGDVVSATTGTPAFLKL